MFKNNSKLVRLLYMSTIALSVILLSGCAKKIAFLPSSIVPAAQGTVKVSTDSNKNHIVDIEVFNLAEPQRLTPPKQIYLVWMQTDQNRTENIGQIKTSTGTFSKSLKASLKAVSSFHPVKIYITAENDPDTQFPSREIILTTKEFKSK